MPVKLIKTVSARPAADYLAGRLNSELASGHKVFWLMPGGSAIEVAVQTSRQLSADTAKLVIGLTDERYGPVGHKDSNWRHLTEAGFDPKKAKALPVLTGQGLKKTAADYSAKLDEAIKEADYKIGFFGIGADGHTGGIKPGSLAVTSRQSYEGYPWEDFSRLTITPKAIARLDEIVVWAAGGQKRPQLESLAKDLPVKEQPAQALKQVDKLTIFNDQIGEEQ